MFSETRLLYEDDTKKSNRIVFYAPIAGQIQFCRLQFKCMLQICFCQGFRREIGEGFTKWGAEEGKRYYILHIKKIYEKPEIGLNINRVNKTGNKC